MYIKYYSLFRMFVEYILISVLCYFITSLVVSYTGDWTYRSVLSSKGQYWAIIALYIWFPIPRILDMIDRNRFEKKKYQFVEEEIRESAKEYAKGRLDTPASDEKSK